MSIDSQVGTRESALSGRPCVVCASPIRTAQAPWSACCPLCGTWASDLEPAINRSTQHVVDEDVRAVGLETLRRRNYERIVSLIGARRSLRGARLLDVGCAHGWFLDAARETGAVAIGVEPDDHVAAVPLARGLDVRTGYFPDAVGAGERFDVITFNDVLEHIPDVRGTVEACAARLSAGGLLAINIPNARGLAFRTALLLKRLGLGGPYQRLWQTGLPSPHMHYFNAASLAALLRQSGFTVVADERLAAITRDGLWERVHTFRRVTPVSVAGFAALWTAAPILNRPGNSDILFLLAERD